MGKQPRGALEQSPQNRVAFTPDNFCRHAQRFGERLGQGLRGLIAEAILVDPWRRSEEELEPPLALPYRPLDPLIDRIRNERH